MSKTIDLIQDLLDLKTERAKMFVDCKFLEKDIKKANSQAEATHIICIHQYKKERMKKLEIAIDIINQSLLVDEAISIIHKKVKTNQSIEPGLKLPQDEFHVTPFLAVIGILSLLASALIWLENTQ